MTIQYLSRLFLRPQQIKPEPIEAIEPVFEVKSHIDESHDDGFNDLGDVSGRGRLSPDPLSTVLNGDAGAPWYSADNREVVKRQLELLDYQMETAKVGFDIYPHAWNYK